MSFMKKVKIKSQIFKKAIDLRAINTVQADLVIISLILLICLYFLTENKTPSNFYEL